MRTKRHTRVLLTIITRNALLINRVDDYHIHYSLILVLHVNVYSLHGLFTIVELTSKKKKKKVSYITFYSSSSFDFFFFTLFVSSPSFFSLQSFWSFAVYAASGRTDWVDFWLTLCYSFLSPPTLTTDDNTFNTFSNRDCTHLFVCM